MSAANADQLLRLIQAEHGEGQKLGATGSGSPGPVATTASASTVAAEDANLLDAYSQAVVNVVETVGRATIGVMSLCTRATSSRLELGHSPLRVCAGRRNPMILRRVPVVRIESPARDNLRPVWIVGLRLSVQLWHTGFHVAADHAEQAGYGPIVPKMLPSRLAIALHDQRRV